jgi:hypothetical protein
VVVVVDLNGGAVLPAALRLVGQRVPFARWAALQSSTRWVLSLRRSGECVVSSPAEAALATSRCGDDLKG